jgi:long-chain acyl-CoA synthetase
MPMTTITADDLPLQRIYRWERERASQPWFTQPVGTDGVREFTWAQAMDETRRMAAWLQAQGFEPGSRIALMSKNTAWWIMADVAIWMAGHVSVPIYPNLTADSVRAILEHSESRLIFVGKLDDWRPMVGGIPAGVVTVGTPLNEAPVQHQWDDIVARTAPLGIPVVPEV